MNLKEFVDAYMTDSWEDILTICRRAGIKTWTNFYKGARATHQLSTALVDTRTRPAGVLVKWDSYICTYLFKREQT